MSDDDPHSGTRTFGGGGNAYDAFMRLFTGANTGKLVLKIADGL